MYVNICIDASSVILQFIDRAYLTCTDLSYSPRPPCSAVPRLFLYFRTVVPLLTSAHSSFQPIQRMSTALSARTHMEKLRSFPFLRPLLFVFLLFAAVLSGCTGTTKSSSPSNSNVPSSGTGVTLTVCPATANVRAGATQSFSAQVTGTTNTSVTWQVNGVTGGNAAAGTISSSGVYTAPNKLPSPNTVTVRAVSSA